MRDPHEIQFHLSESVVRRVKSLEERVTTVSRNLVLPAPSETALTAAKLALNNRDWAFFDSTRGTRLFAHLLVDRPPMLLERVVRRAFVRQLKAHPSRSSLGALFQLLMALWGSDVAAELRKAIKSVKGVVLADPMAPYLLDEQGDVALAKMLPAEVRKAALFCEEHGIYANEEDNPFLRAVLKWKLVEVLNQVSTHEDMNGCLAWLDWFSDHVSTPYRVWGHALAIRQVDKLGLDSTGVQEQTMNAVGDVDAAIWYEIQELDENAKATVRKGKEILEGWINELFLERFWHIVEDPRRRAFWKRYTREMRDVKLVLDEYLFRQIRHQLGEGAYRQRVFHGQQGGLLLFRFRGKMFVEFGGQAGGALQVVPLDHPKWERLMRELSRYRSDRKRPGGGMATWDFKLYGTSQTIYKGGQVLSEFGKFNHAGRWETSLREWMSWHARD